MALIKTVRGWTPKIGKNCYLAENATIVGDVEIGDSVSIGHNAVIHGAKIHNRVLVGIGAIILDHAEIGENSIIAAGALIKDSTIVEPNSIYAGVPARKVKDIDPEQTREMIDKIASNYLFYAGWYR